MRRFLQGLGAGILIATLILTVAYYTGGRNKISNEEIMSRAKKLGMIKPTEAPLFTENNETENGQENNPTQDGDVQNPDQSVQNPGENMQDSNAGENAGGENGGVDNPAPEGDAQSENSVVNEDGSVSLVITAGENATDVSRKLFELGIVQDATDFDYYLRENAFSRILQKGVFTLRPGMSYEEITAIISKNGQ